VQKKSFGFSPGNAGYEQNSVPLELLCCPRGNPARSWGGQTNAVGVSVAVGVAVAVGVNVAVAVGVNVAVAVGVSVAVAVGVSVAVAVGVNVAVAVGVGVSGTAQDSVPFHSLDPPAYVPRMMAEPETVPLPVAPVHEPLPLCWLHPPSVRLLAPMRDDNTLFHRRR
jgi:hypothetical protein